MRFVDLSLPFPAVLGVLLLHRVVLLVRLVALLVLLLEGERDIFLVRLERFRVESFAPTIPPTVAAPSPPIARAVPIVLMLPILLTELKSELATRLT